MDIGLVVLNNDELPFPGSGQQGVFRKKFGELLINNSYSDQNEKPDSSKKAGFSHIYIIRNHQG
jgi:hypothetical protein